jgi:hypothetical protein
MVADIPGLAQQRKEPESPGARRLPMSLLSRAQPQAKGAEKQDESRRPEKIRRAALEREAQR